MTIPSWLKLAIARTLKVLGCKSSTAAIKDNRSFRRQRSNLIKERVFRSSGAWKTFRSLASLAVVTALAGLATDCTRYGTSGPEDLGLAARFDPLRLPTTLDPADPNKKLTRNQVLNEWLLRSDFLCNDYLLQLSRSIRDSRLATDFLGTVLSGLATIFAQPAVTRPLSGAATIALGVGGDIQSDLFLQQAGDVVSTAIEAVRTRARTELQKKWTAEYADYTLEQGFVDVQRYDRETCNMNVGLNEIRASLNIIGPIAPQANNPIIPLSAPSAETGAGLSAEGTMPGATAPLATTIIPPNVQKTPQGGFVFTPGKIVTTPEGAAPPTAPPVGAPSSDNLGSTPSSRATQRFAGAGATPTTKFRPATAARSDLLRALLLDPHGKIDPARGELMRKCWQELLNPPPAIYSIWLQQASDQALEAVAVCINEKAAAAAH